MADEFAPSLALIDAGLFWAYWHAAKEEPGVAVDRFVGMCRTVSLKHNRTIVCTDSDKLFRRAIPGAEGYKRGPGREKPPDALADLARAIKQVAGLGLTVWRAEGYEADDGLAAWASEAAKLGWLVRIYSDDKDMEACVLDGAVTVYKRDREKGGAKDWTSADVLARRGCMPPRVPEYLALVGDDSDSIPGVKGIGDEGAKAVLQAYAHALDAWTDVDPAGLPGRVLPERMRKQLKAGRESFDLSYALAKLDLTAAQHIDRSLLSPPQPSQAPDDDQGGGSAPDSGREEEPSHVEQGPQGTVTQVLQETQREEEKPSMLEQVAAATEQRARIEGWIGRSFEDALEPRSPRDAWWLAEVLDGAMSPGRGKAPPARTYAKIGNKQAIYAVIMKGRELKLPAMLSLAHIKPVEGKIEVDAMLMVALALRSGRVKYVTCVESTPTSATWETLHSDPGSKPQRRTWTIERAKEAGLYPASSDFSPWKRYTETMLRWRAVSELLRMVCPDAVVGVYVKGEIEEELDEAELTAGLDAEKRLS